MALEVWWRGVRTSGVALEPARLSVRLKGCGVDSEAAAAQVRAAVSQRGEVRDVQSQANFQRWVLVSLDSLVVAVAAMAIEWLPRTNGGNGVRRHRLTAADR